MAWNEPGGPGDKDPWGQRGDQGPPDLDEIVKKMQRRLGGVFGGGKGGGGDTAGKFGVGLVLIVALVLWLASGFYVVNAGEASVVLRFGKYVTTTEAGLHWRFPYPIERNEIVNVQKVNTVEVGYRTNDRTQQRSSVANEALMLTEDENIIDVQFAIQFRIKDPKDLLFNVSDPANVVVRTATESAVREVVGRSTMDFVITSGRAEVVQQAKALLQEILDRYQTGIDIVTIEMQNAQPPQQVKAAFDDAVKAREDEERLKNEAEAYANETIPGARGQAARLLEEAEAYKASVIARAEGDAQRFTRILAEYKKAPDVTRERLYLEAMESMLSSTSKLLVDQKDGGSNVFYLPLDRMMERAAGAAAPSQHSTGALPDDSRSPASIRGRGNLRPGRGEQ
jgi:membrane protease subunit HflK